MFWVRRLKEDNSGTSWELSYGDLMSLLMAVFVMITAMSELKAGQKFGSISNGVRSAFGFSRDSVMAGTGPVEMTFLQRLRQAGFEADHAAPRTTDAEVLSPCEIRAEDERVIIQIAGTASFNPESPRLKLAAQRAVLRIAEFLSAGQTELEIRGYSDVVTPGSGRDELELSYQRARAVVELLAESGVGLGRLRVTAQGIAPGVEDQGRRIEIVVHPVPAIENKQVAEKEQL